MMLGKGVTEGAIDGFGKIAGEGAGDAKREGAGVGVGHTFNGLLAARKEGCGEGFNWNGSMVGKAGSSAGINREGSLVGEGDGITVGNCTAGSSAGRKAGWTVCNIWGGSSTIGMTFSLSLIRGKESSGASNKLASRVGESLPICPN